MIQVHHQDEQDLRWWADDEYDAMKQPTSSAGSAISYLERGVRIESGPADFNIDRHLAARARLERIQARLALCTESDLYLLRNAFQSADCRGLLRLGSYPRGVIGTREAELACSAAGRPLSELLPYLRELCARAEAKKGKTATAAQKEIRALRETAEQLLCEALARCGMRFTTDAEFERTTLGLKALSRVLHSHPDTVRSRLTELRVRVIKSADGRSWSISVRDLQDAWPEAARKISEARTAAR